MDMWWMVHASPALRRDLLAGVTALLYWVKDFLSAHVIGIRCQLRKSSFLRNSMRSTDCATPSLLRLFFIDFQA